MKLCFDIDFITFSAASWVQQMYITVTNVHTKETREFPTRTMFYGHHKAKAGGWLSLQVDAEGLPRYSLEDFTIEDGVRLRTFDSGEYGDIPAIVMAKKFVDNKIEAICTQLGAQSYFGYTGRGTVFRHESATLLPYKGQRSGVSPLLLKELKDYVVAEHNIEWVEGVEADDMVSIAQIAGYKAWKAGGKKDKDKVIAVAIDKDAKQTEGWFFNPDTMENPELVEGYGKLWLNSKGDVDGRGRMWLYYQVASGDTADNYCANCFSETKWASKSAYKVLVDCKDDKQAFEALVRVFKKLYPEPKIVEGCKGKIEINWLHVLQECFTMAFMLRNNKSPRDKVDVKLTLEKLGVIHE